MVVAFHRCSAGDEALNRLNQIQRRLWFLVEDDSIGRRVMKNHTFHQRKIRVQENPELDFDQLKARTVNALNKLGHQKFSSEPGGYALENWVRGVNVLLDEFEGKAGATRLTLEYKARRQGLNDYLSKPASTSSIDAEISELGANISDIEGRIEAERVSITSRISELKVDQARLLSELERERRRVGNTTAEQQTNSYITRLFMRKKSPTRNPENRISELESKVAILPNEILDQQRQLKTLDLHSPESPFAEDWKQLDSMRSRMKDMENEKLDKIQLVKERAELTGPIADAISRIQ